MIEFVASSNRVVRSLKLSFFLPLFPTNPNDWAGGRGRNRTMSSRGASLKTLIYKGILSAGFQGFKHILTLSGLTGAS